MAKKKAAAAGRLAWLLPVTYALHAAEEYRFGFPRWLNALVGARLTSERFLELNGFAWLAMVFAVWIGTRVAGFRVLLVVLATMVALNGSLHAAATLITARYSPGTATGFILWVPLGLTLLSRLRRELPGAVFWGGVAAGLSLHALLILGAIR